LWTTYRPRKGQAVEMYYLDLDNRNPGAAVGRDGIVGFYNVSTLGARYSGDFQQFLWDFEGMYNSAPGRTRSFRRVQSRPA